MVNKYNSCHSACPEVSGRVSRVNDRIPIKIVQDDFTKMKLPNFDFEQQLWTQGKSLVAGIDEVGRGPLAGPVVVCAIIFDQKHQVIEGINDSKKLTAKKRTELAEQIKSSAHSYAIGIGNVELINQLGITQAITNAMISALEQLGKFDHVLIDGRPIKNFPIEQEQVEYIIKGDGKSYSIAAASILAKVFRDQMMANLASEFPNFGWDRNMGYGTLAHRNAIKKHGICIHHRKQFVRNILKK